MLRILGHSRTACDGWSRRDVLQVAGTGLLGVNLPQLLAAEEQQRTRGGRAKSVLFVFLFGGPSQLETFDLKPDAATGIRGPYRPIDCRTPGLLISEKLPRLAQISDKFAVVRTVTHKQNDHNACHYIQTGHPMPIVPRGAAQVDATDKDWPAMGSVIEYLDTRAVGGDRRDVPSYIYLPNRLGHIQGYDRLGQYGGWLGRQYNALATDIRKKNAQDNPYFRDCSDDELQFRLKELDGVPEVTLDRLNHRRGLLDQLDDQRRQLDQGLRLASFDRTRDRAFTLATSQKLRDALDLRQEPDPVRDRFGRHLFGQSAVVARRMLEAGARFVTLLWDCPDGYSWDSHIHNHDVDKHMLPGLSRLCRLCWSILKSAGCWTRRWWSAWEKWAAPRKGKRTGGATTGASAFRRCSRGREFREARCSAGPIAMPPTQLTTPSRPKIWRRRFSVPWGLIPRPAFWTPRGVRCPCSTRECPSSGCLAERAARVGSGNGASVAPSRWRCEL